MPDPVTIPAQIAARMRAKGYHIEELNYRADTQRGGFTKHCAEIRIERIESGMPDDVLEGITDPDTGKTLGRPMRSTRTSMWESMGRRICILVYEGWGSDNVISP